MESNVRSLVKAVSYRIVGTISTFVVSYGFTGSYKAAVGITATEFLSKIGLFWMHERIWQRIKLK